MIINIITGASAFIAAVLLLGLAIWLLIGALILCYKLYHAWMDLSKEERVSWAVCLPLFLFVSYWLGYFLESFGLIKL